MIPKSGLKERLKWWLYPGINLHARDRNRRLPPHFGRGDGCRRVLDAGCGNGMLAWQAYRLGNRVVGVTLKENEAEGCRRLFHGFLGVPESRLSFEVHNLRDPAPLLERYGQFDEIICAEVIEHIVDDRRVCRSLWEMLRPGGVVHITTPNAEHPYNASFPLDRSESGGHVRAGYTPATFRELLEPIGFEIGPVRGLGGPVRQAFNSRIKKVQERFGAPAGLPLFLLALPLLPLDRAEPPVPFSLYVQGTKPRAESSTRDHAVPVSPDAE